MFITADNEDQRYRSGMENHYIRFKGDFVHGVISADDETGVLYVDSQITKPVKSDTYLEEVISDNGQFFVQVDPNDLEILPPDTAVNMIVQIDWHEIKQQQNRK